MKVYVVLAEINGNLRFYGVYRSHSNAEDKCREIKNRNFFFAEEGDETWVEEEEVK